MPDPLDAFLLLSPEAACPDDEAQGRRAARWATSQIEARLKRSLVLRPSAQAFLASRRDADYPRWSRQWPVASVHAEASGDALAIVGMGDETGEALVVAFDATPEARAEANEVLRHGVHILAGYRRSDQTGEEGRAAINAAIEASVPAWGDEAVSETAWTLVPVLPLEVEAAAEDLAQGWLQSRGVGLGALKRRRQARGDADATVELNPGWEADVLSPLDRLAWLDL